MTFFGEIELTHSGPAGEMILAHHRPNHLLAPHRHDEPFLSLCLDGAYSEEHGGGDDLVTRGDLYMHPARERHGNDWGVRGATVLILTLTPGLQRVYGADREQATRRRVRCPDDIVGRVEYVIGTASSHGQGLALLGAADILLAAIEGTRERAPLDPRMEKARLAIDGAPERGWRLSELADIAGLNRIYFAQRFRRELGCTPGTYHRRSRMRKAISFICSGDGNLTDAAHISGYFDSAHMTRSFRRMLGAAPSRLV